MGSGGWGSVTSGIDGEENGAPLEVLVGGGDLRELVLLAPEGRASPLTLIRELLRLKIPIVGEKS